MDNHTCTQAYSVNVRDAGARGDGQADDTAAIQIALDGPQPVVIIPEGHYCISRTLRIGSGKTVYAHGQAVIRYADGAGQDRNDFVLTNNDPIFGNQSIRIIGGIWDGNNAGNTRGADGDLNAYTGVTVNFVKVRQLELRDLTIRDPESFSIRLGEVEDFLVENITLDHRLIRPNQDGVHVGGYCERGVIRNIRAETDQTPNDDMVALNADDDVLRAINLGMRNGPIRHIHVENLYAKNAYTFLRILSKTSPAEYIRVRNIEGGCRMHALNLNRWRFEPGCGNLRHIDIRHVRIAKTADAKPVPLIPLTLGTRDLYIEDFTRTDTQADAGPSLILNNGMDNQCTFEFADDMPGFTQMSYEEGGTVCDNQAPYHLPDGSTLQRGTFHAPRGKGLILSRGSIGRLILNPVQ